jgi:hypothetical protein
MFRALIKPLQGINLTTTFTECNKVDQILKIRLYVSLTRPKALWIVKQHSPPSSLWLNLHTLLPECIGDSQWTRLYSINSSKKRKIVFLGTPEVRDAYRMMYPNWTVQGCTTAVGSHSWISQTQGNLWSKHYLQQVAATCLQDIVTQSQLQEHNFEVYS